jgi:hypothetical protein
MGTDGDFAVVVVVRHCGLDPQSHAKHSAFG